MPKFTKKRSKKAGLPSETLMYTGEKKGEKIIIHVIDYDETNFLETELSAAEACIPKRN
jgi:magnesium transporter